MAYVAFALYNATKEALNKFRQFLPAGAIPDEPDDPEAARAFVNEWAQALAGVKLEAIPDAVSRWLRDPELVDRYGRTRIPSIASFAMYARRVDHEHHTLQPVAPTAKPTLADQIRRQENFLARACEKLGSHEAASRVIPLLLEFAQSPEERTRIRACEITMQRFDEAIEIVREQIEREKAAATVAAAC